MYILYESYNDNCKRIKDLELNTKIVSLYNDEEKAISDIETMVNNIIATTEVEYDWYVKKVDTATIDDNNVICMYEVFNKEIDNYDEYYTIIIQKNECKEEEIGGNNNDK